MVLSDLSPEMVRYAEDPSVVSMSGRLLIVAQRRK
jgi:hypothetical protein